MLSNAGSFPMQKLLGSKMFFCLYALLTICGINSKQQRKSLTEMPRGDEGSEKAIPGPVCGFKILSKNLDLPAS
jgi:hypothetical protein